MSSLRLGKNRVAAIPDSSLACGEESNLVDVGVMPAVREHRAVHFYARAERLTALLLHLPAEGRILDDVLLGVIEIVLLEHGTDAIAPTAVGLEPGGDGWFFHDVLNGRYKVGGVLWVSPPGNLYD